MPMPRTGALLVGAGILLSRVAGLIRERAFAHVFGAGEEADVFRAAFRIPNLLQNLLGEGVLSAAFIPTYARLQRDDPAAAARLAGAVLCLLLMVTAVLVSAGVFAAPWLVDVIAPGFAGGKRDLAVTCVEVFFPAMGLLVLSAWCLGVLNTHGRFFASYAAPAAFNAVLIVVLLFVDAADRHAALLTVAAATIVAAGVQLGVQLPFLFRYLRGMSLRVRSTSGPLRTVVSSAGPVLLSRGVVQISAFAESAIASLLPMGAVAALGYAQVLYTLPSSLFAQAVVASELPDLARGVGDAATRPALTVRIVGAQARICFFIVPSAAAFLCLGDALATLLFQTGAFGADAAQLVWLGLAGSSLGLLVSTQARLLSSAFFALGDTRMPLRAATVRVIVGIGLGYVFALHAPNWLQLPALTGIAGITLATSLAAVVEWQLLARALRVQLPDLRLRPPDLVPVLMAAAVAGVAGVLGRSLVDGAIAAAAAGALTFCLVYGAVTLLSGVGTARALAAPLLQRLRRLRRPRDP